MAFGLVRLLDVGVAKPHYNLFCSFILQIFHSLPLKFSIISYQWKFSLNNGYGLWLISIILLISLVAIYFSWYGLKRVNKYGKRILLFSLRVIAIVLITLIVLQPQLGLQKFDEIKNKLVFIFDSSKSMTLRDSSGNLQRNEEIVRFVDENQSYINQLEEEFDLEFLMFSETTNESSRTDIETRWDCSGDLTDIGQMLHYLVDHYNEKLTEALLLFSDGGDNTSEWADVSNQLKMFEELASSLPAPLYSFGFGRSDKIKDIAITNVKYDEVAFVRNPTDINVEIRIEGFDGIKVPVTIKEGQNIISSKLINVFPGKSEYSVDFTITPYEIGSFIYSISTPVYENELVKTNNNVDFSLFVARDKIRVLHITGRPSWDVRFMRYVLKQTPNIDLISFYILKTEDDVSDVPTSELSLIPFPIKELFTEMLNSFDLVIFQNFDYRPFDIPRNAFRSYFDNLRRFVFEAGGGFLMIGGDISFSEGGYEGTQIEDILPVELNRDDSIDTGSFNAVLSEEGGRHPISILEYDYSNNIEIWENLPALNGCNKVSGVKAGATTIATHPNIKVGGESIPIIAVKNMGKGRSMAVMTDSLWRWGFSSVGKGGTNKPFIRFWDNAIKWLSHDAELNPVRVSNDKASYTLGDKVKIRTNVFDANYKPIDGAQIEINIIGDINEKDMFTDIKETDDDGKCYISFIPESSGYYKVMIKAKKEDVYIGEDYSIFNVKESCNEFDNIDLREDLLKTISGSSEGAYIKLQSDDKLKDKLTLKNKRRLVPVGKKDYSIWDNWIVFIVVLGILSIEWWLRVKTGLG